MAYITSTPNAYDARRKPDIKIDTHRFAADLAKALGGVLQIPDRIIDAYARISLGNDVLTVYGREYPAPGKIDVSITAGDVPSNLRNSYANDHKTQSASVNPDGRDIKRIAADIKRRVVDASQDALAAQRQYAADKLNRLASLADIVAKFRTDAPAGWRVELSADKENATFSGDRESGYISGRIYADGTVSIDRSSSIGIDKFQRIAAILAE